MHDRGRRGAKHITPLKHTSVFIGVSICTGRSPAAKRLRNIRTSQMQVSALSSRQGLLSRVLWQKGASSRSRYCFAEMPLQSMPNSRKPRLDSFDARIIFTCSENRWLVVILFLDQSGVEDDNLDFRSWPEGV